MTLALSAKLVVADMSYFVCVLVRTCIQFVSNLYYIAQQTLQYHNLLHQTLVNYCLDYGH